MAPSHPCCCIISPHTCCIPLCIHLHTLSYPAPLCIRTREATHSGFDSIAVSIFADILFETSTEQSCLLRWVGPWEKVSQNIDPSENHFFVTNYQHWTGTSALEPFLAPPAPWGGLGGPRGVLGGLPSPKFPLSLRDQFQAWDALFWIETTCNTMFLSFRVKMGPSGPKKGRFGPK